MNSNVKGRINCQSCGRTNPAHRDTCKKCGSLLVKKRPWPVVLLWITLSLLLLFMAQMLMFGIVILIMGKEYVLDMENLRFITNTGVPAALFISALAACFFSSRFRAMDMAAGSFILASLPVLLTTGYIYYKTGVFEVGIAQAPVTIAVSVLTATAGAWMGVKFRSYRSIDAEEEQPVQ